MTSGQMDPLEETQSAVVNSVAILIHLEELISHADLEEILDQL